MSRIRKLLDLIRDAVRRHGGGWSGMKSVATRSVKVTLAIGLKGLIRRIRAARERDAVAIDMPTGALALMPPLSIEHIEARVGIMAHIYYPDLIEEFAETFANLPLPYTLMVSTMDEDAKAAAIKRFSELPMVRALHVRTVPNRGRDIAPLLLDFRGEISTLDLLCHVHTKKSLYTGGDQSGWRRYLMTSLLGSKQRVAWILGTFASTPELGIVFPESFPSVPLWAHTWLSNAEWGRWLAKMLGFDIDTGSYLNFPAGSMFWARVSALKPLFDLNLTLDDFPEEKGQIEGTLHHAIERMFGLVALHKGMRTGILPASGVLALTAEGERNRLQHFDTPIVNKIDYFSIDAKLVSFDIFDTLVIRTFLEPRGSRAYLAHQLKQRFGIDMFAELRTEAESLARARLGRDPGLGDIYAAFAEIAKISPDTAHRLHVFELDFERSTLRPRVALVEALNTQARATSRRVMGLSDMYLSKNELRSILPRDVGAVLSDILVSCDTGMRKDDASTWQALSEELGVATERWLHVGDNENSDVYYPLASKLIPPVHVLRPAALLSVVPALRGLRPNLAQRSRWEDQLWLGLVANRFTDLADARPELMARQLIIDEPELMGYTVLGPLIVDYLAWLARLAIERRVTKLLFLSREGYLLHRIYSRLSRAAPELEGVGAVYFLASRRGVNTPAIFRIEDIAAAFDKTYTGTLDNLLDARLGRRVADIAGNALGAAAMRQEVYLPDMAERLVRQLANAAEGICNVAAQERLAYLDYWSSQVAQEDRVIVADIGYSGSIQAQLAHLTGRSLCGAYFAVSSQIAQVETLDSWASARFYDERHIHSSLSPVMQCHLLLESVLTSPNGQFSHFERSSTGPVACYRSEADTTSRWAIIERIHTGAMRFAEDVCAVTHADWLTLSFDSQLVQEPLRCVGNGTWQLGDWAKPLSVEDYYTGRGWVATHASSS